MTKERKYSYGGKKNLTLREYVNEKHYRDDKKPDPNRKEQSLKEYINKKHYEGL